MILVAVLNRQLYMTLKNSNGNDKTMEAVTHFYITEVSCLYFWIVSEAHISAVYYARTLKFYHILAFPSLVVRTFQNFIF